MSAIVSSDDRVRRIITDPAGYFAEARARAKRQVRAEMKVEAERRRRRDKPERQSRG